MNEESPESLVNELVLMCFKHPLMTYIPSTRYDATPQ